MRYRYFADFRHGISLPIFLTVFRYWVPPNVPLKRLVFYGFREQIARIFIASGFENNDNKCNNNNNSCKQSNIWKLIADFLKEILFSRVEYVVA